MTGLRVPKVSITFSIEAKILILELIEESSKTRTSLVDCLGENVSATNLAHFLIEQLANTEFVREAPFLATL